MVHYRMHELNSQTSPTKKKRKELSSTLHISSS